MLMDGNSGLTSDTYLLKCTYKLSGLGSIISQFQSSPIQCELFDDTTYKHYKRLISFVKIVKTTFRFKEHNWKLFLMSHNGQVIEAYPLDRPINDYD